MTYRVLVAPDKFKGTLDAVAVSEAIARGVMRAWPSARVVLHPIADGGEGTVDLALRHGYQPVTTFVAGPLGQEVRATLAVRGSHAVVEMATAAGLSLLGDAPTPMSALRSSTLGVGELIRTALDQGARHIVVGAGGSCSTDGGAGAIVGLGGRLLDADGRDVPPQGGCLARARSLDLRGLDPRALDAEIVIACDVEAVLTGPRGAAEVFGPQKGADLVTVRALDHALETWAHLVGETVGRDVRNVAGSGAAGGLAFGLMSVLGASIVPGADALATLSRFDDALSECDVVIVGEGSLDAQSLLGKGPVQIARRAAELGISVIAVVGRSTISAVQARAIGIETVIAIADHVDRERSMSDTAHAIEDVVGWSLDPESLSERTESP